jgi:uncharacterized coiled-coil protein SlyX
VESNFSTVNHIVTKQRNCLKNTERDLRALLTKIEPDIQHLVDQHKAQRISLNVSKIYFILCDSVFN